MTKALSGLYKFNTSERACYQCLLAGSVHSLIVAQARPTLFDLKKMWLLNVRLFNIYCYGDFIDRRSPQIDWIR